MLGSDVTHSNELKAGILLYVIDQDDILHCIKF